MLTPGFLNGDIANAQMARFNEPEAPFRDFSHNHKAHVIAIPVPMSGPGGLYAPSCIAAAQLAVTEINARGGIGGIQLEAALFDADAAGMVTLGRELDELVKADLIAGVVSMSVSEVRQYASQAVAGRVPYVFTSPYDGNERSPNVFTIGATPREQLVPGIVQLARMLRLRRWAIVGKNKVWQYGSAWIARQCIVECGGFLVYEKFVPFGGLGNLDKLIGGIVKAQPDVIYLSLVGQDAADFNRAFGEWGLDKKIVRFSELEDETTLMAAGAENTQRLYAVSTYFDSLKSDIHLAFKDRYAAMHGPNAPAINQFGQSVYEGINFYAELCRQRQLGRKGPITYATARGGVFHSNWRKEDPVYLAEADGLSFSLIDELGP